MGLFTKTKKQVKLNFCTNNIDRFYSDDNLDQLEEFIDKYPVKVKEMDCLSFCDECECSPYCLINNSFVGANSPEQLIEKIKDIGNIKD